MVINHVGIACQREGSPKKFTDIPQVNSLYFYATRLYGEHVENIFYLDESMVQKNNCLFVD